LSVLYQVKTKMTLVKYLYKRFMPVFIGAVAFFSLVLVLVDLLMNLWKFIQNQIPVMQVFMLMLYYVPKTIWYAVPLGILFASSFTLSSLYADNELTAVFASGVSLFKFTLPLLCFSFVMSFALFFFEDKLVVNSYARKTEMQSRMMKEEKSLNNDRIVVLAEGGNVIYKADLYDDAQKRLLNVYFVFRDEHQTLQAVIHADSAKWDAQQKIWKLQNAKQYVNRNNTIVLENVSAEFTGRLVEPAETFRNNTLSVEEVTVKVAKEYIEHLIRTGLPYNESLSLYYKKFAFPFVVFIVVFLSIGLSGRTAKNVMLTSLAFSISAAVLFYVTQMVTMLLAKFGYISAFSGAWFPVVLFTIISVILLRYART
jgi:lipopolysaccharide export system permease protein